MAPVDPAIFDYVSSNTDAATVDENGLITPTGSGITNITASLNGIPATGTTTLLVPGDALLSAVFDDDYGTDVEFVAFGGADNDIRIDDENPFDGAASLRGRGAVQRLHRWCPGGELTAQCRLCQCSVFLGQSQCRGQDPGCRRPRR